MPNRIPILYGPTIPAVDIPSFSVPVPLSAGTVAAISVGRAFLPGGVSKFICTGADGIAPVGFGRIFDDQVYVNPFEPTASSSTDTLTYASHGLLDGDKLLANDNGGTLPGGLSDAGEYFVVNSTTDTFQVSATSGGSPINLTTNGSGSFEFSLYSRDSAFRVLLPLFATAAPGDVMGYLYYDSGFTDQNNRSQAISSDTLIYWPLESLAIVNWLDESGGGTHGIPGISQGILGKGIEFSNNGQDVEESVAVGSLTDWTLSVLFKSYDVTELTDQYIFSAGASNTDNNVFILAIDGATSTLLFGNPFGPTAGSTVLSSDTWYHAVVTSDGSSLKLYINGVLETTGTPLLFNPTYANLGNHPDLSTTHNLLGMVDEVQLFGTAYDADWAYYKSQSELDPASTVTLGDPEFVSLTGTSTFDAFITGISFAATGTVGEPLRSGSLAHTITGATFASSATFAAGTHTVHGTLIVRHTRGQASMTFSGGTHTASSVNLTTHGATLIAAGVYADAVRIFIATGLTTHGATFTGAATVLAPIFSGIATGHAHATFLAGANFIIPRIATAVAAVHGIVSTGSLLFAGGTHTASIANFTAHRAVLHAVTHYTGGVHTATAALLCSTILFTAEGTAKHCDFVRRYRHVTRYVPAPRGRIVRYRDHVTYICDRAQTTEVVVTHIKQYRIH